MGSNKQAQRQKRWVREPEPISERYI